MKIKTVKKILFVALLLILVVPQKAHAMHIMEGFLPLGWCLFWYAAFIPFFLYGLFSIRKAVAENPQNKVLLAFSGAFIFILSALKIHQLRLYFTSNGCWNRNGSLWTRSDQCLGTICLLFQALLLAHGGITTLRSECLFDGSCWSICWLWRLCASEKSECFNVCLFVLVCVYCRFSDVLYHLCSAWTSFPRSFIRYFWSNHEICRCLYDDSDSNCHCRRAFDRRCL